MHTQARTNLTLWLLTGRADKFVSPHLNTFVRYPTLSPSQDIVEARRFLRLDVTTTDFYVLGAMAAAYASMPALRELPDDNLAVFSRNLLQIGAPSVTGATVAPLDGVSWPSLRNRTSGASAWTALTVTRVGDKALITSDSDIDVLSDYRQASTGIVVEKLAEYGIRASFDVTGGWSEGADFTVTVPPSFYPFHAVASGISERGDLLHLMSRCGTMEAFASSTNPVLKVGALSCAVILDSFRNTTLALDAEADAEKFAEVTLASKVFYENHQLSVNWLPVNYEQAAVTYYEP